MRLNVSIYTNLAVVDIEVGQAISVPLVDDAEYKPIQHSYELIYLQVWSQKYELTLLHKIIL